jgi:hypothetical protein
MKKSNLPKPEPIELAKLAAILRPDFQPKAALKTAMQFYVEAVLFSRELPSTLEELLNQFGSEERQREIIWGPLKKVIKAQWADTLELDPKKDDAPTRHYLAQSGLTQW